MHHFLEGSPNYDGVSKFVRESYRILKEKGAFIVNTATYEQVTRAWFVPHIIPNAGRRLAERSPE